MTPYRLMRASEWLRRLLASLGCVTLDRARLIEWSREESRQ